MRIVRRRLFWKIYLTLLASLVVVTIFLGALFWLLGEAQREVGTPNAAKHAVFGPAEVTLYASDGRFVGARGRPITLADYDSHHRWGPGHIMRLDLPGGGFVLTRFGPPGGLRSLRFLMLMLIVAGIVGLAAYPVTALLTRRLETLRGGVARWGETAGPLHLEVRGSDEVALLAQTFNAAAARIAALIAAQRALLANASHELRSPLARLRVAIETGLDKPTAASRAEIVRNLAEMDQLVDELLLSSRLEHPESRKDRPEPIDLLGLAAEEAARYDASAGGEAVEIDGDAILLRRLVRNLLDNAAKHGRPPITIEVGRDGALATLRVADGGPGIAPADRERIFEPFFRPAGSGEAAGGWGLGLALVRQIAERHGGGVECRATAGGGTMFVVRLAVKRN